MVLDLGQHFGAICPTKGGRRVGEGRRVQTRMLFRLPSSLRKIFTFAPVCGPLCPTESVPLVVAIHMRREFKVDMSEFVYSFARGMLKRNSHPPP